MSRLILILLFLGTFGSLQSQNLGGKWVGYFTSNLDLEGKTYPYEINILAGSNNQINANTLTKFSNFSSARAIAKGIYTPQTQLLNIQETKFDLLHLDPNMQACLMNNYLTYRNIKGQEVLQGTYMAKNDINGKDCGTGTVYLIREDPIVSVAPIIQKKVTAKLKPADNKLQKSITIKNETSSLKSDIAISNNQLVAIDTGKKNIANQTIIQSNKGDVAGRIEVISTNPKPLLLKEKEALTEHNIIPWVLISRENNFVKKIITHNKTFSFDLYDNGTIDNDSITIYDNKKLMMDNNRLSYKPIHVEVNFSDTQKVHEIIVVANNLGSVPPNTALLIYKDEAQNEEILINTNLKTNAKLIIEYQAPTKR